MKVLMIDKARFLISHALHKVSFQLKHMLDYSKNLALGFWLTVCFTTGSTEYWRKRSSLPLEYKSENHTNVWSTQLFAPVWLDSWHNYENGEDPHTSQIVHPVKAWLRQWITPIIVSSSLFPTLPPLPAISNHFSVSPIVNTRLSRNPPQKSSRNPPQKSSRNPDREAQNWRLIDLFDHIDG